MEKRGIATERGNLNREIEVTNQRLRQLYLSTAKLAERGTGEHRAADPCRCDTGYTITAGSAIINLSTI